MSFEPLVVLSGVQDRILQRLVEQTPMDDTEQVIEVPRSLAQTDLLLALFLPPRRWRNSCWKCWSRLSQSSSSILSSRTLTFQFMVVVGDMQQIFKVSSQDRVQQFVVGLTIAQSSRLSSRTVFSSFFLSGSLFCCCNKHCGEAVSLSFLALFPRPKKSAKVSNCATALSRSSREFCNVDPVALAALSQSAFFFFGGGRIFDVMQIPETSRSTYPAIWSGTTEARKASCLTPLEN